MALRCGPARRAGRRVWFLGRGPYVACQHRSGIFSDNLLAGEKGERWAWIDALSAPELAAFLTTQLAVAPVVVVNLDGVRFMESAGLSALCEAKELANREDRVLRLVCNSQIANWALEFTGLREQFTFADSVPDAVKNSSSRL